MADQGKWFKLWGSARRDQQLGALSKENFTDWCLLGTYLKENGNNGMICLAKPADPLRRHMEFDSYEALVSVLRKFPNCIIEEKQKNSVTDVTILTVTWLNWRKYQGDFSGDRVRKFRQNVTPKKRREEKRGEENNNTPLPPQGEKDQEKGVSKAKVKEWFEKAWKHYPAERRHGKDVAFKRYAETVKDLEDAKRCARVLERYIESDAVKKGYALRASRWFGEWRDHESDENGVGQGVYHADGDARGDGAGVAGGVPDTGSQSMLRQLADSKAFGKRLPGGEGD